MRKFLTQKFWSLGTNLGSPGSLSQDCSPEIFSKLDFPHIWGLNECPVVAKPRVELKKLKTFRPGCEKQRKRQIQAEVELILIDSARV